MQMTDRKKPTKFAKVLYFHGSGRVVRLVAVIGEKAAVRHHQDYFEAKLSDLYVATTLEVNTYLGK